MCFILFCYLCCTTWFELTGFQEVSIILVLNVDIFLLNIKSWISDKIAVFRYVMNNTLYIGLILTTKL